MFCSKLIGSSLRTSESPLFAPFHARTRSRQQSLAAQLRRRPTQSVRRRLDLHLDHHLYLLRFDSCGSRERGEPSCRGVLPKLSQPDWGSLASQENRACEPTIRLVPVYRAAMRGRRRAHLRLGSECSRDSLAGGERAGRRGSPTRDRSRARTAARRDSARTSSSFRDGSP